MKTINLLDCTLRDGGYINNWNFGKEAIHGITQKITQTGIEAFEVGFIRDVSYNPDYTIFSSVEDIKKVITPKAAHLTYVGMIDMEAPLPIEKLSKYDGTSVDALRIIFKKDKMQQAYEYCKKVNELGYKVFVQLVNTDLYNDTELVEAIKKFNTLRPFAVSVVDTFGLMKKKEFLRQLYIIDHNLEDGIALGYHSHNNLQQAFANAESMIELDTQRDLYIDACVFGMGRGAGNLNLELFATHLNDTIGKNYRIEPMLEIIDEYLNAIYKEHFWGYSLPFYLSASLDCHPNYASYFDAKGTLSLKSFRELIKQIPQEQKERYSKDVAEKLYTHFLDNYIDDKKTLSELKTLFGNKQILILAPGATLSTEENKIKAFIEKEKPIVISLNFISEIYNADYVFSCNMRRYYKLQQKEGIKKIITSNIKDAEKYDYMINFSSFSCDNPDIIDNSGLILLNLLYTLGIKKLAIAGMDGYLPQSLPNYYDSNMEASFAKDTLLSRHKLISDELKKMSKCMDLKFITATAYN